MVSAGYKRRSALPLSGLADLFLPRRRIRLPVKGRKRKKAGLAIAGSPWRGDTAAEKVRRTVFLIALATLLVCLPFLGYRLYEGWYNDYFTKQLAGQVQTGLDESAWADIRAKYPNVNFRRE